MRAVEETTAEGTACGRHAEAPLFGARELPLLLVTCLTVIFGRREICSR